MDGEVAATSGGDQAPAARVRCAGPVVALTGAGISVPSGIPDVRSRATGIWENVDPIEVAHIAAWRADPERRGLLDAVVAQNIVMLHRRGGTQELIEVHGSIASCSCLSCGESHGPQEVMTRRRDATVAACACDRPLKPDVVLFGEFLPQAAIEQEPEALVAAL